MRSPAIFSTRGAFLAGAGWPSLGLAGTLFGLLASPLTGQVSYTATDIGSLAGGSTDTYVYAINNAGQMAGASNGHAFFYDGTMHDLGAGEAYAINSSGVVAGRAEDPSHILHSFTYDGTLQLLEPGYAYGINSSGHVVGFLSSTSPPNSRGYFFDGTTQPFPLIGDGTVATGINDSDQAVGFLYNYAASPQLPFLYQGGVVTPLPTFGGTTGGANAINNAGKVVGFSQISGDAATHAFLYDGTMHDLGTLGGDFAGGYAINAFDVVVGESYDVNGSSRAFVYASGSMIDLNLVLANSTGTILTTGQGINDLGQIVAQGANGHSYLLVPIPEPAGLGCVAGLIVLGWAKFARGNPFSLRPQRRNGIHARRAPRWHQAREQADDEQ